MFAERDRLKSLIDYVEATERDRFQPALDVADHRGFRRYRDEVLTLPGVRFDLSVDDEPVWLAVDRLVRCPPPAPTDATLKPWLDVENDPAKPPALKAEAPRAALTALDLPPDEEATALKLADHPARAQLDAALDGYRREVWTPWAEEERPRRRAIELYTGLFSLRQLLDGAGDKPIELNWGIGVARWTPENQTGTEQVLRYPLITVPVELSLDERTHAIHVRPRSEAPPVIETDALDELNATGLDEWRRYADAHLAALEEGISPFAPDGFAAVLRRAVALLDAHGCYLPDLGEHRPPAPGSLTVDGEWVIFERPRRATQLMDDLHRLKAATEALATADSIPPAVLALLQPPAAERSDDAVPAMRGVSTVPGVTSADGSGADLFFPKPFNREQVEVIGRLATRPGVVVQGPPGTGKTHTIANIISHYLALGKRVLVTSQKAPALKVLRDKLPPAVRPLAVSLLDSDRDGLKQFQESVDVIAERLGRTQPSETREQIKALDARIDALHRALASVDREVDAVGRLAMTPTTVGGAPVEPADAARRVVAAGDLATWLSDPLDTIAAHEPAFDEDAIARLRAARKQAGQRLHALDLAAPPADLPDTGTLLALHDTLVEADTLRRDTAREAMLRDGVDFAAVTALRGQLDALAERRATLAAASFAWTPALAERLRADPADAAAEALAGLADRVERGRVEANHFLTRPVSLPADADPAFREGVAGLAEGRDLGLFQSLFARATRARLAAVRIAGRAPANAADWGEIDRYARAADEAAELRTVWNHAAAHAGLDPVTAEGLAGAESMRRQLAHLATLRDAVAREAAIDTDTRCLMPGWPATSATASDALRTTLDRHARRLQLEAADERLLVLRSKLGRVAGSLGQEVRATAALVGEPATDPADLDRRWSAALAEAAELQELQPAFRIIRDTTAAIEQGGAPRWAAQLREQPVTATEDPLTPGDWRTRWTLRRLATWLDRIDRHGRLRELATRRSENERQLARAYEEAIELRTWCRLAEQATDGVRAALAAYAQAMRRLGRGTGVRAGRHRADARAAADRAKNALPCWIMPHYRVSESLPPELGLFDLVVVDEASQSTVAALPALLRAKQVLIVGDDRQVSPDAGFRAEERLTQLADRFLGNQIPDYRAAMREDRSLYDLGTVAFAGGAIMLKEHFRCVGAIIEYSKAQFYSHQLVPLRLPSASERLDPPLVDILVEDGYRKGKVNPPEVDCIVDQIGRIADDPLMANRTVGVTTLLGIEQAAAIDRALQQVLGPEIMLRHDIRVGEPAAFQGDERDIMFVSLVAAGGTGAVSGLGFEQRFNVAASRARDRMVLVRSVEPDQLSPADKLRRSLIEHFHAPFAADGAQNDDRRARCESGFEREMFDLLNERGYRVDTQVPVGTKRIDLVVEGADDRRLAIECDGDAFHGPDRWPDDMARQRMLERAGWTVWRCFASRFVRERDAVMAELLTLLDARGIAPELDRNRPPSRHTEHRRWRSAPPPDAEPVPYAWLVPADPF